MASADAQPRFGQSVKGLLADKVGSCSGDVIALTRQVLKGSRNQELLGQAARNMVIQEDAILHSEDSLRKMSIITTHLQYHHTSQVLSCVTNIMLSVVDETTQSASFRLWRMTVETMRSTNVSLCLSIFRQEAIQKNVEHSKNLQDQLRHLLK